MTATDSRFRLLSRLPVTLVLLLLGSAAASQGLQNPQAGVLLIANDSITGGPFHQSVVLLTAYGPRGTEGVILNRPSPVTLAQALPELVLEHLQETPVAYGGPVSLNSLRLLIHSGVMTGPARHLTGDVYYSSNAVHLDSLLEQASEYRHIRFFAGYAGWLPGQLENEIRRGDWQLWPGSADLIFSEDTSGLWQKLHHDSSGNWVMHQHQPR